MKTAMRYIAITLLATWPCALFGQAGGATGGASSDSGSEQIGGGSPLDSSVTLDENDTISVDFPSEEIRTVLRNVADLYMLNLVVPETLQGTTSIKLRDVTWRQIFQVVLEPVGYTYVEEGNIVKVVSKEALSFEPPVTEIFIVNYADARAIANTLSAMVDAEKGGRVQVDARTNGLIVTERQSRMGAIKQVIERLDKPTQQVLIETRFIEVTNRDQDNVGVNWASLRGYEVGAGPVTREKIKDKEVLRSLGGLVSGTEETGTITTALFTADEFSFVISALNEQNNSRLVSNPTVVTLNNQEAEISIGEQFPIPNYTYNDERGSFEVSGFEYKDIGVILRVKPSVNDKGLITLQVTPEVSSQAGTTGFGGASGASIPIIATRRTTTQIALQDGYTMGIGGLMETRGVDTESKVPIAHKIPGIGGLFKSKGKDLSQLNLLIFITARILPAEDADYQDVFTEEAIEAAGVDAEAMRNR